MVQKAHLAAESLEIAELALEVVELLAEGDFSEHLLFSLRAEAYTAVGNYHRILGDLRAAQGALDTAEECLEMGTGDLLVEARQASVRGSLLRDLGNFEEAAKSVRAAISLFRTAGEPTSEAENWIGLATILKYLDPAAGILAAERARQLIEANSRLRAYAEHAKIDCMLECGYASAAYAEFSRDREILNQLPEGKPRVSVKFLSGRIAAALGYRREAFQVLAEVVESYRSLDLYQEMCFAQLQVIWLLIQDRKWKPALKLAGQTIRQLERLDLRQDALAVWLSLREKIEAQTLEHEAVHRAAEFFARYWKASPTEGMEMR